MSADAVDKLTKAEEPDDLMAGAEKAAMATKPVPKKPVPVPKGDAPAAATSTDAAAPKATVKPPVKPPAAPAKKPAGKGAERRNLFLTTAFWAWGTFAAATAAATLGTVRFMFPNVLAEPPSQFKVGPLDPFAADAGAVNEKWKNEFKTWIINLDTEKRLIALSTTCTHLGCTPSWLETEKKFKCPCHGSGFYKNGINFEGPAPRPLERYGISVVDGVVVVDKSKIFQYELGKWNDAESFIALG